MTTAIAGGKPSGVRRGAAAVALAALLTALPYSAVSALSDWYVLLASVVSFVVVVIILWFILLRRGLARAIAGGVATVALIAFAVVVIATESLTVLAVGLGPAAVSIGAASYALNPVRKANDTERALRAQHPVLLMNPSPVGVRRSDSGLVEWCREHRIEPIVLDPGDACSSWLRTLSRELPTC